MQAEFVPIVFTLSETRSSSLLGAPRIAPPASVSSHRFPTAKAERPPVHISRIVRQLKSGSNLGLNRVFLRRAVKPNFSTNFARACVHSRYLIHQRAKTARIMTPKRRFTRTIKKSRNVWTYHDPRWSFPGEEESQQRARFTSHAFLPIILTTNVTMKMDFCGLLWYVELVSFCGVIKHHATTRGYLQSGMNVFHFAKFAR